MSKFWDKMSLLKKANSIKNKGRENEETYFLHDQPPHIMELGNFTILRNDNNNFTQLSTFYNNYYMINKTNFRIKVSEEQLRNYHENLGAEIVCLYDNSTNSLNNLIGSIISFAFPIKIIRHHQEKDKEKEIKAIIGCSSYLILHNKYRGKGLGILMIQESLKMLHQIGGRVAYFINKVSRGDNSILLPVWYYPIEIKKLDNCKYPYPNLYDFSLSSDNSIIFLSKQVSIIDLNNAFNYYNKCIEDKEVAFSPSYDYFCKWVSSFPSFLVYDTDLQNIVGFFSIMVRPCYYPNYREIIYQGYLILNVGNNNIRDAIHICRKMKLCDIINFYEVGNLNASHFKETFCQKSGNLYINFYNLNLYPQKSKFFAPII